MLALSKRTRNGSLGALLFLFLLISRHLRKQYKKWQALGRLKSQRVLITGAAGGLGTSLIQAFFEKGCRNFILWDLDEKELAEVAKPYIDLGAEVHINVVNIGDFQSVNQGAADILSGGMVDVIVNNAGIVSGASLLKLSPQKIELTMKINAMAHMWMAKAFLPAMITSCKPCAIISISSAAAFFRSPRMTDYCASKHAAVGFSESLRVEMKALGHHNIRVICMCPGKMRTKLFEGSEFKLVATMEPSYVAERTVQKLLNDDEGVHVLPFQALIGVMCATFLPLWMLDAINRYAQWNAIATLNRRQSDKIFSRITEQGNESIDQRGTRNSGSTRASSEANGGIQGQAIIIGGDDGMTVTTPKFKDAGAKTK